MTHLKILHVIGQRPEMTGSGIYLEAIIRESQKQGFSNYWVAGVPAGRIHPLNNMPQVKGSFVFFESKSLDFPVTGMSDVMPYKSSLFRELKGKRLTAYKSAFTQVLQAAKKQFDPDIIHSTGPCKNGLWAGSAISSAGLVNSFSTVYPSEYS